jgi:hypothetical protein
MRLIIVLILLISLLAIFYVDFLGGPVHKIMRIGNCEIDYVYYFNEKGRSCNWYLTNAGRKSWEAQHCVGNSFNVGNAKRQIGQCLCETYRNNASDETKKLLFELIESDKRLHDAYISQSRPIASICEEGSSFFGLWMIE